jgi:hypothetical protein
MEILALAAMDHEPAQDRSAECLDQGRQHHFSQNAQPFQNVLPTAEQPG